MGGLVPFEFEGASVRVITQDGEPWFVLADICRVLEIGNVSMAASRLDDDEKGVSSIDTLGGAQQTTIISESGLYSLILTSRKEAARRFKKWVTAEVIPAIRRTGRYGAPDPVQMLNDPAAMRGLLLTYTEKVLALEAERATLAPKAEALDRIAGAEGSLCITDAAKALGMRPKDLFAYLQSHGWIYKRPGGAHFLGYQSKVVSGCLEHRVTTVLRGNGEEKVVEQVLITGRGLAKLAALTNPVGAVAS